jgi:acyl-CoA reductase-like NAD-dependent aldehyde dehydrogenase
MLIGGEWRQAASSEEIEVVNPATEEVVGTVPSARPADVDDAVATARRAFPAWAATDVEERAHVLARAAALIEERAKDLAGLLTAEQGKPIAEARAEVTHLVHGVRYYAEAATKVRGAYQELPSAFGPAYGQVIRRPMGVCAAITPYNFPLTLLGTKVAPALACGNTVVAKPASTTPLATLAVARLFADAGVPDGVLNVVTGRGSVIGDALVSHPEVRRVAFTGETGTGRRIMSLAGPLLKRVTLELGGSDPVIVCADADVDTAVKSVIIGRYWNAGQACLGCKRVYVADEVYDAFVGALVERVGRYEPGDGTVKAEKPRLRMGPIHTRSGRDTLVEQLEDGAAKGGEVLIGGGTGGHDKGWFLEPAVVAEPAEDSRLVREEVFGPVLPLFRFRDFDDAIRRANDTPYGLGSSIWTHDVRKIHRAAQHIDAGMTWVNQIHYGYDELPFGGIKDSGFGKEHGLEALDSYVELKSVVIGGLDVTSPGGPNS